MQAVTALAQPQCEALGYDLVDVEYVKEGESFVLRLMIDKEEGVTIDDCERVSRQVEPLLDASDPIPGSYYLQVSSPGLDRPLKREADFERFRGSLVAIRTYGPIEGRRSFRGVLKGLRDGEVVLEDNGKDLHIPFDKVAKARLVPQF